MAFPNDLSDVVVFKIHPAIGVARVANNDDYYVFGRDPGSYKSNGHWKRQAVQFRVFAYGDNHTGLGELTPEVMASLNITAVWSAKVANRKIARLEGTPLGGTEFVIAAEASSDDANAGALVGSLPTFAEGAAIPLGQITSTGLFIPPKGGVYRKTPGEEVEPYPAVSTTVADTTCDGSVSVRLVKDRQELPSLPACIIVAPQDFSPEVNPPEQRIGHSWMLLPFLRQRLQIPSAPAGNLHNQTARAIDEAAIRSCTADFAPGFEVCFEDDRSEVIDTKSVFYQASQDPLADPREMRPRYKTAPGGSGAVPGQLTSGLCSPWQGDFTACVGYWAEHLPIQAYLDEATSTPVQPFRKKYANHSSGAPRLTSGDDFAEHVDKIGVMRMLNSKLVETERDAGDDIG
jgi:L-lysine epsilon oxidase-like protein